MPVIGMAIAFAMFSMGIFAGRESRRKEEVKERPVAICIQEGGHGTR